MYSIEYNISYIAVHDFLTPPQCCGGGGLPLLRPQPTETEISQKTDSPGGSHRFSSSPPRSSLHHTKQPHDSILDICRYYYILYHLLLSIFFTHFPPHDHTAVRVRMYLPIEGRLLSMILVLLLVF